MPDELKIAKELNKWTPEEIKELVGEGELASIMELTLKDETGKVVERRVQKSRSFVRQFLDMLVIQMAPSNAMYARIARELTGGYGSLWHDDNSMNATAGAGTTVCGVIVGTGVAAPTINDFLMSAQIGHGTGAGQLQYGNVAFGAVADDAVGAHFTVTRDFANGSGGSITVNEIGLAFSFNAGGVSKYYLVIRDVVSPGLAVPNGQTLTVNYRVICNI